jgi:hypothetical protein
LALKSESLIERQILDYLTRHPEAQDTSRGINEWWLLKQAIMQSTSDVEIALANLVAKGELSSLTGPDGTVHYSRSQKGARKRNSRN